MRKISKVCLLAILMLLSLAALFACGAKTNLLTVTFDLGEFGTSETPLVQTVLDKKDIVLPIVTPSEGYVFSSFYPKLDSIGTSGNVTLTAIYLRPEMWLIDEDGNDLGENYIFNIPAGQGIFVVPAFRVAVKISTLSGDDCRLFYSDIIGSKRENISLPNDDEVIPLDRWGCKVEENEFLDFDGNSILLSKSVADFSTVLRLNLYQDINNPTTIVLSIDIDVYVSYNRTTAITIEGHWANSEEGLIYPGGIVDLDVSISYESDSFAGIMLASDLKGVITRIWSENGDEIAKDDFSNYAFFSGGGARIETTELLSEAWRIEFHLLDERDNITSNSYTLYISVLNQDSL